MTFVDFLLVLFYHVDWALEVLNLRGIRSRGPDPTLYDSELITIELAGEFLGIECDEAIWKYFRRYHGSEFPRLLAVDRSTFVRQSANLWRVKQLLLAYFGGRLPQQELESPAPLWLLDSFPLRVCRFKRAPSHKLFAGEAAYGKDPTDGGSTGRFYGFKVHLRTSDRGVCMAATIAPANYIDAQLVPELSVPGGCGIGDRAYWNPLIQQQLREGDGFVLLAPFRKESSDPWPERSELLRRFRHVIETTIGQLATRFHAERTWARDLWHLTVRLGRKLLSHTLALFINHRQGNPMLQLDRLIAD